MRKGSDGYGMITILSNLGSSGASYTLELSGTGYASGQVVTEIISCKSVTVDSSGNLAVSMGAGIPNVFYLTSHLTGSGICGLWRCIIASVKQIYNAWLMLWCHCQCGSVDPSVKLVETLENLSSSCLFATYSIKGREGQRERPGDLPK